MPYPADPLDHPNLAAAHAAMQLSPQEIALYQRHLSNLYGPGGVDNPDGSRSSLYQAVMGGPSGRYYSVPTVWNGQIVPPRNALGQDEVVNHVAKAGWDAFPSYATSEEADARYEKLHSFMERDTADYFRNRLSGKP